MRILIATDAWEPQVNGVVNTWKATVDRLRRMGHEVQVLSSGEFNTFACPTYPEIRLACRPYAWVARAIAEFAPDCLHIATEGPIGLAARRYCLRHGCDFTSSYHTRFPEYIRARWLLPLALTYRWLRWFHAPAKRTLVPTPRIVQALQAQGFRNLALWSRGVDAERFHPGLRDDSGIVRPLYLYVGRVAVEKNFEAFLDIGLPGTKWVIGDGPQRESLAARYPAVRFLGARAHDELAPYYGCADVLVFPSKTDTFGLVMIEAMACGTPVAAYPVEGPIDVVEHGVTGILDNNLESACRAALALERCAVRQAALRFSWEAATHQLLQQLVPFRPHSLAAGAPATGKMRAMSETTPA